MAFDKNNLITWTELAPSLQELFKFNQTQIFVERANRIYADDLLDKAIDDLIALRKKKVAQLRSYVLNLIFSILDPRLQDLLYNNHYMDGMVLKLNTTTGTIYADDGYRNCCVVETEAELAQMKRVYTPIDLTTVFNSWYRYAHYCSDVRYQTNNRREENTFLGGAGSFYQNTGPCNKYLNVWTHNMNAKSITVVVDWSPTCGFISPINYYTNYYIRTRYNENDDDFCFIVVGYTKDSAGVEHTLSIVSCTPDPDSLISWALIYDMDCPTQDILEDYTDMVGTGGGHGTHYISAKRINSSFIFKKTPANSTVDNEAWTIKWSYPSTKPNNMPQEEYDNIGKMLTIENRVGFGVTNMPCTFYITDQHAIFDDQDIYALHTDDVWTYNKNNKSWYVRDKIRNVLPDRTFMYNPYLQKLVYRKYWNNWTTIKTKD